MQDQQWRYKATHDVKSDISVTQLINSPQIVSLQKKHADEIVEDASENVSSLLGSLMHQALENVGSNMDGWTVEKRIYYDVAIPEMGQFKVSGMFDTYDWESKTLADYKLCSVWEHIHGPKVDWVNQLNVLAFMAVHNGYEVERATVEAVYRDWSKGKASNGGDYPPAQTETIEIPLWTYQQQKDYIERRVEEHMLAQNGHPAECTPEERWAKDDVWAVMKEGRKSAVKLHFVEEEAYSHAQLPKHYVQHRPGENVRCENYCNVRDFCEQYKRMNNES
jgi:hypothetical protein